MKKHYDVLQATSAGAIVELVDNFIEDNNGWVVSGGLTVVCLSSGALIFYQAVKRLVMDTGTFTGPR